MSTITAEQQAAIAAYVNTHHLPSGLGTKEEACSIAAINLALTGELTDRVPDCMSLVIGKWIIGVQDAMPDAMRNSIEWRNLLPLAAGTGRQHEAERSAIVLDWMWDVVLPEIQPVADKGGYGEKWKTMTNEKTAGAANAAAGAAIGAANAADYYYAAATDAARAAARAAYAADAARAAYAADAARAAYAANAADAAADAAVRAANAAAAYYYYAARAAYAGAAIKSFWAKVDPIAVLKRLVEVSA
jgi:hypothetical protein